MRFLILTLALTNGTLLSAMLVVTEVPPQGAVRVPYTYTGDGDGFMIGGFDVASSSATDLLYDITLTSFDNGDDSTGYSEVGLFMDANANGEYDPGIDVRYGVAYPAFPVDDGDLTFTQTVTISGASPTRFLLVVKLNGPVLPHAGQGFLVDVLTVSGTGGPPSGVPTGSAGAMGGVVPIGGPTPLTLEYEVTGNVAPYTYDFRWVLDDHSGTWSAGQEWNGAAFGYASFENAGTLPFSNWVANSASFPTGPYTGTVWQTTAYSPTLIFSGPVLDGPGLSHWMPAFIGDEILWSGTADVLLDDGEMTWNSTIQGGSMVIGSAGLEPAVRIGDWFRVTPVQGSAVTTGPHDTGAGSGFLMGAFDVTACGGATTLNSLTLAASGTGHDAQALSGLNLYVDSNANGLFDPGVDTVFGQSYLGYAADNGTRIFNGTLNFSPGETKRMLIVAKLDGPAPALNGQTFDTTVTALSGTGSAHTGLPTAVIPGIQILGNPNPTAETGGDTSGGGCTTDEDANWLLPILLLLSAALSLRRARG